MGLANEVNGVASIPQTQTLPIATKLEATSLAENDKKYHKKIWYAPNQFEAYGEIEIKAVEDCLRKGHLAGFGPITQEFENAVARRFGKQWGVFVNSGSSANLLALIVAGVGPGDEVVTAACTFATVIAPLVQLGATPVFCDVEHRRYVPTVDAIMSIITPKTKVIFIPNLIGSKIDWQTLRERMSQSHPHIPLIEDSCDTITYTPYSDISVASFYASHVITAGGSGGMLMGNDPKLKEVALTYRDWGRVGNNSEDFSERFGHSIDGIEYDFKFLYKVAGYNFKSSEMNAAFGLAQLSRLPQFEKIRRANIERYLHRLHGSDFVLPDDTAKESWLALPLMHNHRKELLQYLETNGIQTRVCFAGNVTRHPAFRQFLQDFAEADRIMRDGFLLGAHHGMTLEDVDRVCDVLLSFRPPSNSAYTA
mmetsp:Transcript_51123/g.84913  ORF Transcript_51123/g.84913 Transcript_51123/m.84913 type:complete len:423 (+) Transcript_51123:163-1431(+)